MDREEIRFEFEEEAQQGARLKVVGIGGGGSNAVNTMIAKDIAGVDFAVVNTDAAALAQSRARIKVQIGSKLTRGLGAGSDPEVGRRAALEDTDKLIEVIEGADMVFLVAALGGGTGAGATPVLASLAKELDSLTVALVTKPFTFEGGRRLAQAEAALGELAATVDTVIVAPNDRLLAIVPRGASVADSLRVADETLSQAVECISEIICAPGLIHRDFADVKFTLQGTGYALLGAASAKGKNAAVEAARRALESPLLGDFSVRDARRILIHISGSNQLGLHDVHEACSAIQQAAGARDAQISFGVSLINTMKDAVKVTVIAKAGPPGEMRAEPARPVEVYAPPPEPPPVFEPRVEAFRAAAESHAAVCDEEDLETPAFIRQGKVLI